MNRHRLAATAAVLALGAGLAAAQQPLWIGFGPNPDLPQPVHYLIPTLKIAPASPWKNGAGPVAAEGLAVAPFAQGLDHPRWLCVLPNGDVLVAETNGPGFEKPKGIRDIIMGQVMKTAGAGTPSANRISLLRDADGDGVAETRTVFAQGLTSPFGMALVGGELYIADTDALLHAPYRNGQTTLAAPLTKLTDLPGGPIDHHWTKNVIPGRDGSKLFVTVGSNSNVGENGMAAEAERAAIWEIDRRTGAHRIFASGLRNPNGMGWEPVSGKLWTVVNERDELGDNLVPDYLTSVTDGGFYGWPYSYYGANVDKRVSPRRPDLVRSALVPDYALGSHTASLGLAFYDGRLLPASYRGGAFIGQHGSWNRSRLNGYQVIFVPFAGGKPNGQPQVILTGFVDKDGQAQGRPVGVAVDKAGALLVADDVGGAIWRVTPRVSPQLLSQRDVRSLSVQGDCLCLRIRSAGGL